MKNVIFDKIKINKVLFDKNVKFYINILIYVMILEVQQSFEFRVLYKFFNLQEEENGELFFGKLIFIVKSKLVVMK